MGSYSNDPQQYERKRRVERYAGEFLNEPSMSAAQPLPGATDKGTQRNRKIEDVPVAPAAEQQADWSQQYHVQAMQQPDWSQQYPVQPVQNPGWSQQYPVQPVRNPGWSQQYPAQPVQQPDWSQQYPVQSAQNMGWSQPQPVQHVSWTQSHPEEPVLHVEWQKPKPEEPVLHVDWSKPYPAQPAQNPGWSQPHAPQAWQGGGSYTPPPITDSPQRMPAGKHGGNGGGSVTGWKLMLAAAAVVAIIVALVVGIVTYSRSSAMYKAVSEYNDRFCEGVYVDGIHLGGMTQDEAVQAVQGNAQARLAEWNIRLEFDGALIRKITAADLGMTVNVEDALADAWEQGHASSDVKSRKAAMDALLVEPYQGSTALPSGDTSRIDAILNNLAAVVYQPAQDAYFSSFDPGAHSYPFEIVPDKEGHVLHVEPIKEEIYEMVAGMKSGSVQVVPQTLLPAVTQKDLEKQRVLRGSATTEISTMSTEGRTANIQRAFELSNGKILRPGESYSFNTVVGARSKANGFHLAIEYAYGQEREGYGGGVCQASTTIYLAAVRANMTVTKREPHSDKVNYTEYGLDATVNLDGKKIDLVFKNTTGSDVYILSYLERSGGRWICKVDIWGEPHEEGVSYDLVAQTAEVLAPPADPEYVEDKTGTHVMYTDELPVQKRAASEGYVVETYKVKYVNGIEVNREFVARDTYKAKSQQFWVGVSERPQFWAP